MQPGDFRYKTTIKTITLAQQNDFGDFATSAEGSVTRFAKIKWLPSVEKIEAETLTFQRNAEFTYRFEAVTELLEIIDTITFDNNIFKIDSVQYEGYGNKQYVLIKGSTFTN